VKPVDTFDCILASDDIGLHKIDWVGLSRWVDVNYLAPEAPAQATGCNLHSCAFGGPQMKKVFYLKPH